MENCEASGEHRFVLMFSGALSSLSFYFDRDAAILMWIFFFCNNILHIGEMIFVLMNDVGGLY